jgi:hypothetical protein
MKGCKLILLVVTHCCSFYSFAELNLSVCTPKMNTGETKVSPHSLLIFAIDADEWSAHDPANLIPRKNTFRYSQNKMLGGPQSWYEHFGEKKNLLCILGIKPQNIQMTA